MSDRAQALTEAMTNHRAGKWESAEKDYRQILLDDPECADAWHLLGVLQCQTGRALAAAGSIGHALGLRPHAGSFYNSLGVAYRNLHWLDEALNCYRRSLELEPEVPETLNNFGVLLREQGKPDEAADSYRHALKIKPEYPEALNNLGIALMDQARWDEAMTSFQQALALRPDFAEAHNHLGMTLLSLGRIEEAMVCGKRALELNPRYPEAHKILGDCLRELERFEEAADSYRSALQFRPEYPEAWNNLGVLFMKQEKPEEAIASYRRALELQPDYPQAYNNLGIALKNRGKLDESIAAYRRALELVPHYPEAFNNLANAFWEQGKTDEAETYWRRAIEGKPDFTEAYGNLVMMLYEKDRKADASALLEQWLASAPDNPIARHLAAAFSGEKIPARADDDFIRYSFDHFARTFDEKLHQLEYHAPELVTSALAQRWNPPQGDRDILDAGCGTGLCGPLLRPYTRHLIGVDLSPAMLDHARNRQVYDELLEAELTAYLSNVPSESFDLIASADTLVYFGDLEPIATASAQALRPGGLLLFTLEQAPPAEADSAGYLLQPHGRYCHTEVYVRNLLPHAGFQLFSIAPCVLRLELGRPVAGFLISAQKR